jgi:hypothetical protein
VREWAWGGGTAGGDLGSWRVRWIRWQKRKSIKGRSPGVRRVLPRRRLLEIRAHEPKNDALEEDWGGFIFEMKMRVAACAACGDHCSGAVSARMRTHAGSEGIFLTASRTTSVHPHP